MLSTDPLRLQREKQVEHIVKMLPSEQMIIELGDPENLSSGFLLGATSKYVSGAFPDSILQSAIAVEMTLLLELDRRMSQEEKQSQKNNLKGQALSFGRLIKMAKQKGIVDSKLAEKIFVLHNLRNIFAHPANVISFVLGQRDPEISEKMQAKWKNRLSEKGEKLPLSERTLLNVTLTLLQKIMNKKVGKIPNLDWAAHQSTLSFQQNRLQLYYDRIASDLLSSGLLQALIKEGAMSDFNLYSYITLMYPYQQEIAFEALEIALASLKEISLQTKMKEHINSSL